MSDKEKSKIEEFQNERLRLNELILKHAGISMKRLFNLDSAAYRDGALSAKNKEMLGLVASLVLRCDDCISYHVIQCREAGLNSEEFEEIMTIGWIVGGSITVPHIRRAYEKWEELNTTE